MAETWAEALERVYEKNRKRGSGPTSGRALSKALGGNEDTQRRTINLIKRKNRASETKAAALSAALGVSRAELPPASKPPTKAEILDLLEELEDEAVTAADIAPAMRALWLLAEGKRAEALRVLSEAEAQL